jgi:hypothetical protein
VIFTPQSGGSRPKARQEYGPTLYVWRGNDSIWLFGAQLLPSRMSAEILCLLDVGSCGSGPKICASATAHNRWRRSHVGRRWSRATDTVS